MNCQSCGHKNPAEAGFCMKCGTKLEAGCTKCGAALPEGAAFCMQCGTKVAGASAPEPPTPPAAKPAADSTDALDRFMPRSLRKKMQDAASSNSMVGERRTVTMLFCDVTGSTAAAEQLDPEDWAEIMNAAYERLIAPVYRYEGIIGRLMGDAILAFFGAPIAHEDDPERAVRAGLDILADIPAFKREIRRKWGIDFDVRVGINTGLVVVGAMGSDLRLEYTAMGDAVNLASRMEQSAEPGTVQIAKNTYVHVHKLFELQSLGTVEVKGKSEPVPTWRPLSVLADRGEQRGVDGLESPIVGRDTEVAALNNAVDGLTSGHGAIVGLIAEAGLGKSRLASEARERVLAGQSGCSTAWHEGRALSYQSSVAYAPFIDLFRRMWGIRPDSTAAATYSQIQAHVAEVLPDRVDHVAPFVGHMLALELPDDAKERIRYLMPPQVKAAVFGAVIELLEAMATKKCMVLVFEDLHWADSITLDLVQALFPVVDRVPLVIVGLLRPERHALCWAFHETAGRDFHHRYVPLLLKPLDDSKADDLLRNLLHVDAIPEALQRQILERAEGNPYYVEEVIRSLIDSGAIHRTDGEWRGTRALSELTVPKNLNAVLTTRLDALDSASRRVAQTASVLGRAFDLPALQAIHPQPRELNDALTPLLKRGLVRETSRLPVRTFWFKHGLLVDACYTSMLKSTRRELHGRAADYLVQATDPQAAQVAQHLVAARRAEDAVPWLLKAGDRAAAVYSMPEAEAAYRQAMQIIHRLELTNTKMAQKVFEGLAHVQTFVMNVDGALETYGQMHSYAEENGCKIMQVSADNKEALLKIAFKGDPKAAELHLDKSLAVALESDNIEGQAEAGMVRCFVHIAQGQMDSAMEHLAESARLGKLIKAEEPRLFGMTHTANTLVYLTRFDDAMEVAEDTIAEAKRLGNQKWVAEVLAYPMPWCHMRNGDVELAIRDADKAVAIAEDIGGLVAHAFAAHTLGVIHRAQGNYELSIEYNQTAADIASAIGYSFLAATSWCTLGMVKLDISSELFEEVSAIHLKALEISELPMGTNNGASVWNDVGHCALSCGALEKAESFFNMGLDIPTSGMFLNRPMLLLGLAQVALARGQYTLAEKHVDEAEAFVDERKMLYCYPDLHLIRGRTFASQGKLESASACFSEAMNRADVLGMRPASWQARAARAKVLDSLKDADGAAQMRAEAMRVAGSIAEGLTDLDLRQLFADHVEAQLA